MQYASDRYSISRIARLYNPALSIHAVDEIIAVLMEIAPACKRCEDKNLIAVNNGIFNYDSKELLPFDPELVFLSKSHINYNPLASNPVIHNKEDGTDWDVESWMQELSDDPEVVNLLWEILGAIIRPLVPWNKSAWFYSVSGNSGKGTLCELMRQLCGEGSYASIPLADMGKDFMLEPLIRTTAIIVDENDVGTFIDKAANIKAFITNDVIPINRKFKTPVAYKCSGFMVQCLNELPRIKDKSDSFYRRQLFIPFKRCFTGMERKYIKADYLHRQDVLEYVLFRVLHMNYYQLSEPKTCTMALSEYKTFNDPVRQFAEDILPEAKWDLLPSTFLYDLYKEWFSRFNPSGQVQGRNKFYEELKSILKDFPEWEWVGKNKVGDRMNACELLLDYYGLKNWMNPKYANKFTSTPEDRCTPAPGQYTEIQYSGAGRKKP